MRILVALLAFFPLFARAQQPTAHLARFAGGGGASRLGEDGYALLDGKTRDRQSNALAFDRGAAGAFEQLTVSGQLRALEPGLGGALMLLSTKAYGVRGPAPHVSEWAAPSLRGSFAVGIDLHDPPNTQPFGPLGNYRGLPQREVSLHWDGRELVKRLARKEFRGQFVPVRIEVVHVVGGAEVTVLLGTERIYDRYFVAGLRPYEARLAVGADAAAEGAGFDVKGLRLVGQRPARRRRPPVRVEVFNHVLTSNKQTAYQAEVDLPPIGWAFGRVIMTIQIHDAGKDWDEWDRCGEVFVWDDQGNKHGIVPFITSYRTECFWQVDVTHFRPWLAGRTKLEIAAGTTFYKNRGYMMSVRLAFYHGTPARTPYELIPLWSGTARYRSDANHFRDFFRPRDVTVGPEATAARFWMTTTGHSQIGEFTPSDRTLVFAPVKGGDGATEQRFSNRLWRDDCYLNPNRPQFGTWKYSRAGWAPGDVVRPWWVDLTPHVKKGVPAQLRYEPARYDFSRSSKKPGDKEIAAASQRVRSYLVLYRAPGDLVPAPTLRITNVVEGSNAARAGMKRGDWLLSYDGKRVDGIEALRAALTGAVKAGRKRVAAVVYRGAEKLTIELDSGRMGINLGR